ncbi:hypothetical protein BOA8489_00710 [Boseongicola aestuarii]|uniref:Uncharacterized protein n=1 Tax=Boseongicola aestuarii TaxID=1470561 RepID=A0A238IX98_9RHOB|nr:hypothetical protein BOA8489_00710 [Boseongicola aestuarii]
MARACQCHFISAEVEALGIAGPGGDVYPEGLSQPAARQRQKAVAGCARQKCSEDVSRAGGIEHGCSRCRDQGACKSVCDPVRAGDPFAVVRAGCAFEARAQGQKVVDGDIGFARVSVGRQEVGGDVGDRGSDVRDGAFVDGDAGQGGDDGLGHGFDVGGAIEDGAAQACFDHGGAVLKHDQTVELVKGFGAGECGGKGVGLREGGCPKGGAGGR